MKFLTKKWYSVFIGFCTLWGATPVLAIQPAYKNESSFADLPQKLQQLAQATLGLQIIGKIKNTPQLIYTDCTGVRIVQSDLVLTAGHCIHNRLVDESQAFIIEKIKFIAPNNESAMIKVSESNFYYPRLKESIIAPDWYSKLDLAIIKVPSLSESMSNNILTMQSIVQKIDDLSPAIFKPQQELYGLGWGSKSRFHFSNLSKLNPRYSYIGLDRKLKSPDNLWSESKIFLPFESIFSAESQAPYYKTEAPLLNKISDTNIIVIDKAYVEAGDSGGPLFSCDQASCKLIGVTSRYNESGLSLFTATANLYFLITLHDGVMDNIMNIFTKKLAN
jgi:hypothetical protein